MREREGFRTICRVEPAETTDGMHVYDLSEGGWAIERFVLDAPECKLFVSAYVGYCDLVDVREFPLYEYDGIRQ